MKEINDINKAIEQLIQDRTLSLDGIKSLEKIRQEHADAREEITQLKEDITDEQRKATELRRCMHELERSLDAANIAVEKADARASEKLYTTLQCDVGHLRKRGDDFMRIFEIIFKNNHLKKQIIENTSTSENYGYDNNGNKLPPNTYATKTEEIIED